MSNVDFQRQRWGSLALTLFTFFFLLGSRSLNEPDEGRYAEIAREMIELHDWLVPHLWYVPHMDKPPLTYWAVAVSISIFGRNEWAVRLPLALASISGVWASYLFGRALGGRRVGVCSAIILQSSLLFFVMARMLTTDIFLTQFLAWAVYCFGGAGTVWMRRRARRSQAESFRQNGFLRGISQAGPWPRWGFCRTG
jgi:4-amino-4-deoxy-L-arabinose transferase-like glycosyltransferase